MCSLYSTLTLFIILLLWLIGAGILSPLTTFKRDYTYDQTTNWILVGGLTTTSAEIRIRRNNKVTFFVVSTTPDLWTTKIITENIIFAPQQEDDNNNNNNNDEELVKSLSIKGLNSGTRYYYGTLDSNEKVLRRGTFQTEYIVGKRAYFKFATSGCSWTGSNAEVFNNIIQEEENDNLSFFLHLGDLHYEDIDINDVKTRIEAIDRVMNSKTQSILYSNLPLVYMWDDHDWLGNNRGYDGVGRDAALESYRIAFPHHTPLPSNTTNAIYHAFTVSTVRFIISDLRSEATKDSIYSNEQKQWLFNELQQAKNYDFVIWVTTKPWIGAVSTDLTKQDDSWVGYPNDREELSNWIHQVVPNNLLAISSDAHMIAFDDGSNTYYGSQDNIDNNVFDNNNNNNETTISSFPLLQSGPLDRLGSFKGGPYTEGCIAYDMERNHQYSTVAFVSGDTNDIACLEIKTYRLDGPPYNNRKLLFTKKLCGNNIFTPITINPNNNNDGNSFVQNIGSCNVQYFSLKSYILGGGNVFFLFFDFLLTCFLNVGCLWSILISTLILIMWGLTIFIMFFIPISLVAQYNVFETMILGLGQLFMVNCYLVFWILFGRVDREEISREDDDDDDNNNDNDDDNEIDGFGGANAFDTFNGSSGGGGLSNNDNDNNNSSSNNNNLAFGSGRNNNKNTNNNNNDVFGGGGTNNNNNNNNNEEEEDAFGGNAFANAFGNDAFAGVGGGETNQNANNGNDAFSSGSDSGSDSRSESESGSESESESESESDDDDR